MPVSRRFSRQFSRQFFWYLFSGAVAAAVNFFSRKLYGAFCDFSLAVILGYGTGMLTAFVLMRMLAFQGRAQGTKKSLLYFSLVNLLAVLQTWGISMWLANHALPWLGVVAWRHDIAHAVGLVVPVFTSFFGHKYLSFRQ